MIRCNDCKKPIYGAKSIKRFYCDDCRKKNKFFSKCNSHTNLITMTYNIKRYLDEGKLPDESEKNG